MVHETLMPGEASSLVTRCLVALHLALRGGGVLSLNRLIGRRLRPGTVTATFAIADP